MIIKVTKDTQAGAVKFRKGQTIKLVNESTRSAGITFGGKSYNVPKNDLARFTDYTPTKVSKPVSEMNDNKGTIGQRMNKDSDKYKKEADEILKALEEDENELDDLDNSDNLNEASERRMNIKFMRKIQEMTENGYSINEILNMLDKQEAKSKVTTDTELSKWMGTFDKIAKEFGYTKSKDESSDTNKKEADNIKTGVGTKAKAIKEADEMEGAEDLDSFLDSVESEGSVDSPSEGDMDNDSLEMDEDMDTMDGETDVDLSMVEDDIDEIAKSVSDVLLTLSEDGFIDENVKEAVFAKIDELLEATEDEDGGDDFEEEEEEDGDLDLDDDLEDENDLE